MRERTLLLVLLLTLSVLPVRAGEKEDSDESRDSLVRLVMADRARLIEIGGKQYRKVVGDAVFLHNNTYLYCDSAYWNVDDEYIDAVGHVRIVQENTVLTGDSLKYVIPQNTARFRGHLVELIDRDSNLLRTNYLDYNTRDSIAFFYRGGAMKDHDGNLIESLTGRYQSKLERFDFVGSVEMFSDSLFFVCDTLIYDAAGDIAHFFGNTQGWYDLNCISSGNGRYVRQDEKFYFHRNVHILTEEQEVWCDSLFYDRYADYARLLGNVQLQDAVNSAIVLGGELRYWNEPRRAELYRDPALVLLQEAEDGPRDSVFMASDTLIYYTMRMCDVDSVIVDAAKRRYEEALVDPLAEKKSSGGAGSGSASGAPSSGARAGGNAPPTGGAAAGPGSAAGPGNAAGRSPGTLPSPWLPDADTLSSSMPEMPAVMDSLEVRDSLAVMDSLFVNDSLFVQDSLSSSDSLDVPPPPDTTQVSFVEAYHDVRIFKEDMQVLCDSLQFTSIDSIARLYVKPVIWYEIKSQITADSMQFLIRNEVLDRGYLFSNAFVISEEEEGKFYHQIKSPEMIGYFEGSQISRFDALGGVTAMFYVAEDSVITTMNQKECRLMTGRLKDGQLQRILYMENVKSDAYPIRELTLEMSRLRDFNWTPELRPATRFDVTAWPVRPSRREELIPASDFPRFRYAEKYFEGYMKGIIQEIDDRKPLIWVAR